jgi:hypothetical protein
MQLNVIGNLLDGYTINLASPSWGTGYNSNPLTVCTVGTSGADAGRVYAGSNGACVVTVSNNGFSDTVNVTVSSFAMNGISSLQTSGFFNDIAVSGDYAYIVDAFNGLRVVDISDRNNPNIISTVGIGGTPIDIELKGNLAFIAQDTTLTVMDISVIPPVVLGSKSTPGNAKKVSVRGNIAYVADGNAGLQIMDVANPSDPKSIGSLNIPGNTKWVDVSGNIAVTLNRSNGGNTNGMQIIDVSDPAAPVLLSQIEIPYAYIIPNDVMAVMLDNQIAYVVSWEGGLTVVDFSTPSTPRILTNLVNQFVSIDLAMYHGFLFLVEHLFTNAVPIINIQNPASPIFQNLLSFSAYGSAERTGIALDKKFVYLIGKPENVSGLTRLYIGQYLSFTDTYGVPPVVNLTAPAGGSTTVAGGSLEIAANASDDVAIDKVEFYVNGTWVNTDTGAPYIFQYQVPWGVSTLAVNASAIDYNGNTFMTPEIMVNVISDPLTSANGRVMVGGSPVSDASVTCLGVSATSLVDGTFSISGLRTTLGDVVCKASYTAINGDMFNGVSSALAPVGGGVTNLGDITLTRKNLYVFKDKGLYIMNPLVGSFGWIGILPDTGTISFHPVTEDLYYLKQNDLSLSKIDPANATVVGSPVTLDDTGSGLPMGQVPTVIAFDGTGQMHALTGEIPDSHTYYLVKINPTTGLVTEPRLISGLPTIVDPDEGLAGTLDYDPSSGYLWTVLTDNPTGTEMEYRLIGIDPATGAVQTMIPLTLPEAELNVFNGGISVNELGNMYAVGIVDTSSGSPATVSQAARVFAINKVTGAISYVGDPISSMGIKSLDFRN